MVRSALTSLFSGPASIGFGQVLRAMQANRTRELDEGYDYLAKALHPIDSVSGDSFVSQLALARRLVQAGKFEEAQVAKDSLDAIVVPFLIDKPKMRFAPKEVVTAALEQRLRGSHWRLKEDIGIQSQPIVFDQSLAGLEVMKHVEVRPMANVGMVADIGSRPEQQDIGFTFEAVLPDGRKIRIAVVGDGHYPDGDSASYLSTLFFITQFLNGLISNRDVPVSNILYSVILDVDHKVQEAVNHGGSTFTAFVEVEGEKYVVNIGDSRTFFLSPEGEYTQITIDHSIWSPPRRGRPGGYAFIRSLGDRYSKETAEDNYLLGEPDIFVPTTPIEGGLFLLMSDGISPGLGRKICLKNRGAAPQTIADRIVEGGWMNNRRRLFPFFPPPELDNMTVLVVPASLTN